MTDVGDAKSSEPFGKMYCFPEPAAIRVDSTRRRIAIFELNTLDEPPLEQYQPRGAYKACRMGLISPLIFT
jgi:hypothetical protein